MNPGQDELYEKIVELQAKFYQVSELLYSLDPATTMCKENDAKDEYDNEAYEIVTMSNFSLESVLQVFDEEFDGMYDPDIIKNAYPKIKQIVMS